MTRHCFFVEQIDPDRQLVVITGAAAHHMQDVLRLPSGAEVELCDGRGNGWMGAVVKNEKGAVHIRLHNSIALCNESSLDLILAMALARSDRMELVLRQATELGAARFVAYPSSRSQYRLSAAQMDKRRERWLKIAREAMCQCGRGKLPEIHIAADFWDFLRWAEANVGQEQALRLAAMEDERRTSLGDIWRAFPACRQLLAVVGPEGGWSEEEWSAFSRAGFHQVHLGPRILRLETAAIALVTLAQHLWGDMAVRG